MKLMLYTDGSSSNNVTRCGGWAAVLLAFQHDETDPEPVKKVELYGAARATTNIRMEMTAIIEGLKALKWGSTITVVTDLELIANTMIHGFRRKKNTDLWAQIDELIAPHTVTWAWVKGHAGHQWNELADKLAVAAREHLEQRYGLR